MSDEIIWQVVNQQFCAFKLKTTKGQNFCRNEYNVSGLCNRTSCPLANARYATVKNIEGKLYLYMKTAERAHTPAKMWERVRLLKNYEKALEQIDDNLQYWQKYLIHKCKQRLTRLVQVAINERRLAMQDDERHYVGVKPKVKKRETTRERKALVAAKIEKSIEKELLERLKSGAYGDQPLNVDESIWKKVLGKVEGQEEEEEEFDDEDVVLESGDEDDEDVGKVEYVEDDEDDELVDLEDLEKWFDGSDASDSEDSEDSEDEDSKKRKADDKDKSRKRRRPRVEIEYEEEPLTNIAQE